MSFTFKQLHFGMFDLFVISGQIKKILAGQVCKRISGQLKENMQFQRSKQLAKDLAGSHIPSYDRKAYKKKRGFTGLK